MEHMMPWYFAYDPTNYARYLPTYWTKMCNLKTTHSLAYEEFQMRGSWTIQRQDKWPFASIAGDQGLEKTLNRDTKIQGRIRHFTLIRSAVLRWLYTQPERSEISRACEEMHGCKKLIKSSESSTRHVSNLCKSWSILLRIQYVAC